VIKIFLGIVLYLSFTTTHVFAENSKCQIDLYYANGVLQDKIESIAQELWDIEIEKLKKQYPQLSTSQLQPKISYNSSFLWGIDDFFEAFLNWSVGQAVTLARMLEFENEYAFKILNQIDTLSQSLNIVDINRHISAYNQSLKAGNGVIVVAHSQGNFFTNKAYEYLDQCMRSRFHMIGVASPAASVAGGGSRISWDNDIVPWISLAPWTIKNPNRKRIRNALNEIVDFHSIAYHGFAYYMGATVTETDLGKSIKVSTQIAKDLIVNEIINAVEKLDAKGCTSKPIITQNGAIETTLSWTCNNNIDMDLTLTGDKVIQDIKDEEDVGLEHAYVASRSDIYPGAVYEASATGEKRQNSDLEESYLEDNPINIYAVVKTPAGSKFKQYEARNFGQLNLGEFAVIEVKDKTIETTYTYTYTHTSSSPYSPRYISNPRPYTRTYNECNEEDKKYSCQCVPCEYIIYGMENAVEYGPIGDANVEIIRADTYGSISPAVVYRGKTTNDSDLFKSGLIKFDQSDYEKFEDDVYYVVDAKGGSDLDRDDDLIKDVTPTINNGTIHAIIKGSDLKTVAFRVNVLTEAIYQVSGNLLGTGYDVIELDKKLAVSSKKLFSAKTFIFNNEFEINYHDVLLWAPGVDKRKLFKPYDTFVEPIVVKTYADEPRVKESYRLIYEKLDTDAPQLTPLALEIPHTIPNNSIIGMVNIASEGISGIERIELHGDANATFSINKEGLVKVVDRDTLILDAVYKLDMIAVGVDGKRGISMELLIKIIEGVPLADPNATVPTLESIELVDLIENSPEGTLAAQAHFTDSSLNIVGYNLSGEHNSSFVIDDSGKITVAPYADIDYERSDTYNIKVSAINEAGNESFPVAFSIKIINEIDTPLHDLVYLTYLTENVPIGKVVGKIVQLRDGRSPITSFDILNPNVPFAIDVNGTLRTTGYINYEETTEYNLIAIARTDSGDSNKVDLQIIINDVTPETGRPSIQEFTAEIDENITAGAYVGILNINMGDSPVELVELRGMGSSNFTVDINGTISTANDATLDYEQKSNYSLQVIAHNVNGSSDLVAVYISLNNVEDEAPSLDTFTKHIDENVMAGKIVGTVRFKNSGEGNITGFTLNGTGSEDFTIDENGTIQVSPFTILDYETMPGYELQATVFSDVGESEPVTVYIFILNIPEYIPVLQEFSGNVEENATVGTIVGQVKEEVGGDTTVINYELSGTGSENFVIDESGIIRISDQASFDATQTKIYILKVTAVNLAGSSKVVEVKIEIIIPDITNPEITLRGNNTISVVQGTAYLDLGARAYDDRDGDISTRIVVDNPVDTNAAVGTTYIVSYNVSDLAGNNASTQTRSVTIVRDLNIDLTNWKANGTGNWVLQEDKRTILQTLNADPTVYHNNVDSQSEIFELTGEIKVITSSDDDFIGFVLGYNDDDINKEDVDYLLIDWKQGDQGTGKKGLSISASQISLYPI